MQDLKGRRALVVGAGEGAGREAALALAKAGMRLALADADAAALMRTAALTGRPLETLVLPADIQSARGVDDIMRVLTGHFKGLDALVCCAGGAGALCRRALALLAGAEGAMVVDMRGDALSPGDAAERGVRWVRLAPEDAANLADALKAE